MKIKKFKVTAIFYFKSGNSKKVDWLEERLVKKVETEEREVTESLTLIEADAFFQKKFKEWKDEGATIVRKNAMDTHSVIPFREVEYATVTVSEVGEEVEPVPITTLVEQPKSTVRDISDHPAFPKKQN